MKNLCKAAASAALLVSISCSTDPVPEARENLTAVNAKSSKSILKPLVKGAALNMANGIDIGPDGNLYIASVNGQEIAVMNKNSGKIIDRIKGEADPDKRVQCPDDLVFSPDGNFLYWTDILTGFVGRINMETGVVNKQFIAPGVNPIGFSDDGRLFVALDFLGDGLWELDPELSAPPREIISCPGGFCLGFFNAFDTRVENGRLYLYGPLFAANLVIAIDVTDELPTITGDFPAILGHPSIRIVAGLSDPFENPASAKFSPDGMLYVLDQAGEVWKVNPDGLDDRTLFTTIQPGLDNMVFDQDGTLYMTNNDEGWVAQVLKSGQARIIQPGGMIMPQGLAVMAGPNDQDMVFEADLFSLRQFNGTTGQQTGQYKGFLVPLPGEISLTLPMNISVSGNDLVVSSWFSETVQIWNPQDGVTEDFTGQVVVPMAAVRLNSGQVIVSDLGQGGVIRMSDNALIAPLGVATGMATDGETVWAADWLTGEIVQIDFDGGTPTTSVVASGLSTPEGLAVDNEGRLLVYETQGLGGSAIPQLSRIDLSISTSAPRDNVTTIVEGLDPTEGSLPDFPPMWFLEGVAVGPSGDIYIRGGESNTIYKIPANKVR